MIIGKIINKISQERVLYAVNDMQERYGSIPAEIEALETMSPNEYIGKATKCINGLTECRDILKKILGTRAGKRAWAECQDAIMQIDAELAKLKAERKAKMDLVKV